MTDKIQWKTTPDKEYQEAETNEIDKSLLLYEMECHVCNSKMMWKFVPDSDEPYWESTCCGNSYIASVAKVKVTRAEEI